MRVTPEWDKQAAKLLAACARETQNFTAAEAFQFAFANGLPEDVHPNKLGVAFRNYLIVPGMVRPIGTCRSKAPKAKGRQVVIYESVICRHLDRHDFDALTIAEWVREFNLRKMDAAELAQRAYNLGRMGRQ